MCCPPLPQDQCSQKKFFKILEKLRQIFTDNTYGLKYANRFNQVTQPSRQETNPQPLPLIFPSFLKKKTSSCNLLSTFHTFCPLEFLLSHSPISHFNFVPTLPGYGFGSTSAAQLKLPLKRRYSKANNMSQCVGELYMNSSTEKLTALFQCDTSFVHQVYISGVVLSQCTNMRNIWPLIWLMQRFREIHNEISKFPIPPPQIFQHPIGHEHIVGSRS